MQLRLVFVFFISILFLTVDAQKTRPSFLVDHNKRWVDSVFNTLTIDEKIGQLLMPRGNYSGKPHDVETLKSWVKDYKIGGIVFFASNPTSQAVITNEMQAITKVPLLIGQDFEWGLGMRLDSTDRFPYAVSIGAIEENNDLIEKMGIEIGRQCNRIGVHINYAPVVDINNNPNNPVINFRSFGSRKNIVAMKGLSLMRGMQSQRLLCTAKHFPGHGDTDVDSHHDLPIIPHDPKRLDDIELFPFKVLINNGLSGIMTAHLNIPSLEPKLGLASTFSTNIVQKLLKNDLKFEGLTFTDAMEMQGAVKNFPKGEAMVMALLAGNDILETFIDVPGTVLAIKNAIKSGQLSIQLIDQKVKKVLMAKSWVGLDKYQPIQLKGLISDLNTIQSDVLNYQLTEKSITCLKNEANLLPIRNLERKFAVISVESDSISDFYSMVQNYTKADYFYIPKNAPDSLINSILNKTSNYDIVLASIHLIDIRASKNYGLTTSNVVIIENLASKTNVILNILGNPFIVGKIPKLAVSKSLMMAYQQSKYTEQILPQIIFGALPSFGTFPLDINDDFKFGMGERWEDLGRLSYGVPELVDIDRVELYQQLDSLIDIGINEKAFPGCMLQVSVKGKVIFNKPYGFQTYEKGEKSISQSNNSPLRKYEFVNDAMDNPEHLQTKINQTINNDATTGLVKKEDYFDFASITKISASMLAVMRLMSENKFSLDAKLSEYYPKLKGTNKANLTMKNLLTHRAGLKAWIPFWKDAIDTVSTIKLALQLHPNMENEMIKEIHKPGFLKRLFGKKAYTEIKYLQTLDVKPQLWEKFLTPETRIWKKNIFSNSLSKDYNVKVAERLFLHQNYKDFMMQQIAISPLDTTQGYVYSDLHYYFYPEIIKKITGQELQGYLSEIYNSLGASSLLYKPLDKILKENIIPTEYDSTFRQQLIHGYVHDEGAAMMGGISGHAGLFGNSNDLNKLMQMYLQKGYYGGIEYIKPEVLEMCTAYQFPEEKNRRGIGFDKKDFNPNVINAPSSSTALGFGHSGYTGTYTWVDPTFELVYVFLSNRVYPTRNNNKISTMNIRPAIGDIIIRLINKN